MKWILLGLGALMLAMLTFSSCIYVGAIVIRAMDPFPIREFADVSGPVAASKLGAWDFTVEPIFVRRVSMKSASSIDSYSRWAKFELSLAEAESIEAELHDRASLIDPYIQRTKECEQATRSIDGIPLRSPTSEPPGWWTPPMGVGKATENMFWYPDARYGVAQGCYTLYDPKLQILWVYNYSAQHDSHWERGTRPRYGASNINTL